MKLFRNAQVQLGLACALAVLCLLAPSVAHAAPESSDAFTRAVEKGPLYAALAAFAGGFVVSLTPCVYPMVAVTVSIFGASQAKSRWAGAALSASFVLGIIAMLVPLGVSAGMSGAIFGSLLQSRVVVLVMAALFLVLSSAMFGAFEFALPSALTNRLAVMGGIGYKGGFLLGMACALIAAPCTGPVLAGILTFIGKTRNPVLGAGAMTAFGLGLGVPFFAVGAFAIQLPKSGAWMVHVKSILGIARVVFAFHFMSAAFPVLTRYAEASLMFFVITGGLVVVGTLLAPAPAATAPAAAPPAVGRPLTLVVVFVDVVARGVVIVFVVVLLHLAHHWHERDGLRSDEQRHVCGRFRAAGCGGLEHQPGFGFFLDERGVDECGPRGVRRRGFRSGVLHGGVDLGLWFDVVVRLHGSFDGTWVRILHRSGVHAQLSWRTLVLLGVFG